MRRILYFALIVAAFAMASLAQSQERPKPSFKGGDVPSEQFKEGPPVQAPEPADPCAANISERSGIVTLSLTDPSRASRQTTFTLDEITYATRFDTSGKLLAKGPLFHQIADLTWSGSRGKACRRSGIIFTNFKNTFLIGLLWDVDANMTMHILEPPNGQIGSLTNYIYPDRPNSDYSLGLGKMQVFGESVAGTSRVQLYSLPTDRNPRDGTIYALIEFASRGNPAAPPFCGSGSQEVVNFKIINLDSGTLSRRGARFASVPCGTVWTGDAGNSGYYQIWKWKL